MGGLALLLKILEASNMATPSIVQLIGIIKGGQDSGKTDEEIEAEAMAFALDTKRITDEDKGNQP